MTQTSRYGDPLSKSVLQVYDDNGNLITIEPSSAAGPVTFYLPDNAGTTGQFLKRTASGASWDTIISGSTTFLGLTDTPSSYSGEAGEFPNVNSGETALQFVRPFHSAAADPTVNDDSADGYILGTVWVNTSSDAVFVAVDITAGAAIWQEMEPVPGPRPKKATNANTQGSSNNYMLVDRAWTDETVSTFVKQPDVIRGFIIRTTPIAGTMTGTVTINGTDIFGATIQEIITINDAAGTTHKTDLAFATVTNIVANQTDVTASLYSMGISNRFGIDYPLGVVSDVIKVHLAGDHLAPAGYTVDATYGTVEISGSVLTNDNVEIWYIMND